MVEKELDMPFRTENRLRQTFGADRYYTGGYSQPPFLPYGKQDNEMEDLRILSLDRTPARWQSKQSRPHNLDISGFDP